MENIYQDLVGIGLWVLVSVAFCQSVKSDKNYTVTYKVQGEENDSNK